MGSDQLEVRSPERCLYPGIRSQGCPHRHDLFMLENTVNVQYWELLFSNAEIILQKYVFIVSMTPIQWIDHG